MITPKVMDIVIDNEEKIIVQGNPNEYVLQLHRDVYGSKVAGRFWNDYLTKKLIQEVGFCKSKIDECVFYKVKKLCLPYTDDSIVAGPDQNETNEIIKDIKKANINITVEGDIKDFIGINIDQNIYGNITLSPPHMIDQILKDLSLDE